MTYVTATYKIPAMITEAKAMRYDKWQVSSAQKTVFGEILIRVRHGFSSYLVLTFKTRKDAAQFLRGLRKATN